MSWLSVSRMCITSMYVESWICENGSKSSKRVNSNSCPMVHTCSQPNLHYMS